ncbi:MAG: hypothetical protein WAZ34_05355 [Rhodocyclaceae bacterium]
MADRMMRAGFALLLCCAAASVMAEASSLPDPTRRPGPSASTEPASGEAAEPAGPVLQTVIVPRKGKPRALISGQLVMLGGNIGERRLISLSEKGAILEGPGGIERLSLTPGIEKTGILLKTTAMRSAQSKG